MNTLLKLPVIFSNWLGKIMFFEVSGFPLIILCLMAAGIFLSFKLGFPAQKHFKKSLKNLMKSNEQEKNGLIDNIQSLLTSLSSIVGAGNVTGVAGAILIGGPGAVFWMILMAFFGMNTSFAETLLACKYKKVDLNDKSVSCAPVVYVKESLKEINFAKLGKILSVSYMILYPLGLVGSVMFQIGETTNTIVTDIEFLKNFKVFVAAGLGALSLFLASAGIVRLAKFFSKILPLSCGLYLLAGSVIILANITKVPGALLLILTDAFRIKSIAGGILGTIATGVKRGAYSNEAGLGAATTPYAALKGEEIVKKASLGSLNPFFDTIVICLFSAIVILVAGVYKVGGNNLQGIVLVKESFGTMANFFKYIVSFFMLSLFLTLTPSSFFNINNTIREFFNKKYLIILYIVEILLVASTAFLDFSQAIDIADTLYLSIMVPNLICLFLCANNIKKIYKEEEKNFK